MVKVYDTIQVDWTSPKTPGTSDSRGRVQRALYALRVRHDAYVGHLPGHGHGCARYNWYAMSDLEFADAVASYLCHGDRLLREWDNIRDYIIFHRLVQAERARELYAAATRVTRQALEAFQSQLKRREVMNRLGWVP